MASCQVLQHVAFPLPARRHRRQHPLHKPAAVFTVGPAADPPPDHRVPQGTLGRVVRRLDPLDPGEGPQAIPEAQQLAACRRRLLAGAHRAPFKARTDYPPQPCHGLEKGRPLDGAVADLVPGLEQLVRLPEQLPPDFRAATTAVDHRLKIAAQVHHPNAINKLRATVVIPYSSTTRPYTPRLPRRS